MLRQKVGHDWINSTTKRVLDIVLLIPLLPLWITLVACMVIAVIICDRAVPIICQQRIGKRGKPFVFYKINTMGRTRGNDIGQGANDPRATRLGRLLRLLIFDEIPQKVINVVRGDMGLVGPRPLLQADITLMKQRLSAKDYDAWYAAYTLARPGWTGKFGSASRRFVPGSDEYLHGRKYHDISYVQTANLLMDLRILAVHYGLFFVDLKCQMQRRNAT